MNKKYSIYTLIGVTVMCCCITFFLTFVCYAHIWEGLSGYNKAIDSYKEALETYKTALEGYDEYTEGYAKYTELRRLIDTYYVNDYDETELNDNMAAGVVSGIGDKWAYYVSAEDYDEYVLEGENSYYGIGVTIQKREDDTGFDIVQVSEEGPAKDAGIKAGDIIVEVDGTDVTAFTVEEVKEMVRGETGTTVNIGIKRDGVYMNFSMLRGTASYAIVSTELLDDNVGYLKLENFEGNSAEAFIGGVEELISQGAESLVFDVRNNPGGLMDQLLDILDYLLPEGETFIQIDYKGNETVYSSDAACIDLPMVVLVNENTYSAAEYFAAILQENKVAEVVGINTCGKGNYQTSLKLSDGSAAVISVGKYLTPSRRSLAETGVEPDFIVDLDDEAYAKLYYGTLDKSEDEQLIQAIERAKLAANQ